MKKSLCMNPSCFDGQLLASFIFNAKCVFFRRHPLIESFSSLKIKKQQQKQNFGRETTGGVGGSEYKTPQCLIHKGQNDGQQNAKMSATAAALYSLSAIHRGLAHLRPMTTATRRCLVCFCQENGGQFITSSCMFYAKLVLVKINLRYWLGPEKPW